MAARSGLAAITLAVDARPQQTARNRRKPLVLRLVVRTGPRPYDSADTGGDPAASLTCSPNDTFATAQSIIIPGNDGCRTIALNLPYRCAADDAKLTSHNQGGSMRSALIALSLIAGVLAGAPLLSTEASAAPVLAAPMLQAAVAVGEQAAVQPVQYYYRNHRRYYRRHRHY